MKPNEEPWDRAGLWEVLTEGRKNKKGHICRWAIVNDRNRAEAEAVAADGRFAEIIKSPNGKFDLIRLTKKFKEEIRKSGRSMQDPDQRDEALSFVGLDAALSLPESGPSKRGPSVIMLGCRPWRSENEKPCSVCKGRPIKVGHYCARCDRGDKGYRDQPLDSATAQKELAKDRKKLDLAIDAGRLMKSGKTLTQAARKLKVDRKALYRTFEELLGRDWQAVLEARRTRPPKRGKRPISA